MLRQELFISVLLLSFKEYSGWGMGVMLEVSDILLKIQNELFMELLMIISSPFPSAQVHYLSSSRSGSGKSLHVPYSGCLVLLL